MAAKLVEIYLPATVFQPQSDIQREAANIESLP